MEQIKNPIEQMLDENNTENIFLENANGEMVEFEQIAIIPLGDEEQKLYAILKPCKKLTYIDENGKEKTLNDNDAITVYLDVENENISTVTDDSIIDAVFAVYEKLMEEAESEE